jgi:hypothetical protein
MAPHGVHAETLITILSALGGFACQMCIREAFIKTGQMSHSGKLNVKMAKNIMWVIC